MYGAVRSCQAQAAQQANTSAALAVLARDEAAEHQRVETAREERVERVIGRGDNRLAAQIE